MWLYLGLRNQATINLFHSTVPSAAKEDIESRNMMTATSEIKLLVPNIKQILTTIKSSISVSILSAGK